jgi:hypothetical protein
MERRTFLLLQGFVNCDPSAVRLAVSRCTDWAIEALRKSNRHAHYHVQIWNPKSVVILIQIKLFMV